MLDIITGHCIITGYFNLDICSNVSSSLATDYNDNFSCRGFVSLVSIPTKRTDHSGTCSDPTYILTLNYGVCQALFKQ